MTCPELIELHSLAFENTLDRNVHEKATGKFVPEPASFPHCMS